MKLGNINKLVYSNCTVTLEEMKAPYKNQICEVLIRADLGTNDFH